MSEAMWMGLRIGWFGVLAWGIVGMVQMIVGDRSDFGLEGAEFF